MSTLKDHQQAMVDLLASGSGIPASASRLAHATYAILETIILANLTEPEKAALIDNRRPDATTPGLNDKALAADVEACRIVLTGNGGGPKATPAERRVKELENTVNQLRASNAKLRSDLDCVKHEVECVRIAYDPEYQVPEQAGCRKDDTQLPDCWHKWVLTPMGDYEVCAKCGVTPLDVYGLKKDDTSVCEHSWNYNQEARRCWCNKCGTTRAMEDDE